MPATDSLSSPPSAFSRRQPGQAPSGASAGISEPHLGQSLSALFIIGESLVRSPLLLRKILSEVTSGPQQLDSATHLQYRWVWQPCGRSPHGIMFGSADEIGKTLA